jgi:methionyl-tRNA formyltransferase
MSIRDLRIVFAGTPEFAAVHLNALVDGGCKIVSAYSQPDRPSGRGKKIVATPVKSVAMANGIDVRQPLTLRTPEDQMELAAFAPDLIIVVAYGLLLPQVILDTPRLGCINVHASLLPRWRGAAPIERAILAGDAETGVSIMQMDSGLDTGPILAYAKTPIETTDNSGTLTLKLQKLGCSVLLQVLADLAFGNTRSVPQDQRAASYAHKLSKDEAGIIWAASAATIHRQIRAFYPRSPAYCIFQDQRLRIISATVSSSIQNYSSGPPGTLVEVGKDRILIICGTGALEITEVQLEGKTPMTISALLNGHPGFFQKGSQLLSAVANEQSAK